MLGDAQATEPPTSSSSQTGTLCTICNDRISIYTCPRCRVQTCSLPCSKAHKSRDSCTGERDKVKYVKMNEYGFGNMMDDYVYLEDMGRKVEEWGREIGRGGLMMQGRRGASVGRGRGNGRGGARHQTGFTKRDILKMNLESMDIDMELLPNGMERSRLNQSVWNPKNKNALLTIEFRFHVPAGSVGQPKAMFTLLTHRNSLSVSLLDVLRAHSSNRTGRRKDSVISMPEWARELVLNSDEADLLSMPQCLVGERLDPFMAKGHTVYRQLDSTQPLAAVLRNTQFVEYPTIEVWENGTFEGMIVDGHGHVKRDEQRLARRKLGVKAPDNMLGRVLGEYGSDEEDAAEAEADDVLHSLENYAESDGDEGLQVLPSKIQEALHE